MRISDWSSDVCSSDLAGAGAAAGAVVAQADRAPPAAGRRGGLGPAYRRARPGLTPAQHRRRRMTIPHLPRTRPMATLTDDLASQQTEEHTSELQSLMRISYAVFCLQKKTHKNKT